VFKKNKKTNSDAPPGSPEFIADSVEF
jgi:hypothetical protein